MEAPVTVNAPPSGSVSFARTLMEPLRPMPLAVSLPAVGSRFSTVTLIVPLVEDSPSVTVYVNVTT